MSLIGKEIQPFTATAYRNGEFIELSEENFLKVNGVLFAFIQEISLLSALLN